MECELELGGEGEPISGYERSVVARDVPGVCSECNRPIPARGEREIVTGEYDGESIEWVTCLDCMNIAEAFQTEGRVHQMLWEELEQFGGPDGEPAFEKFNSGCLARVKTASAKKYLQERYQKWRGLA